MADVPLVAQTLSEACLYFHATPCSSCGRGPLQAAEPPATDCPANEPVVSIEATCGACHAVATVSFRVVHLPGADESDLAARVNPTDRPSRIIDVAQWLTLYRIRKEAADRESDKIQVRRLNLQAAECLEEALKFYDDPDNDLPPPEALMHEESRLRFKENPERFSRQRLINLRAQLPSSPAMRPGR